MALIEYINATYEVWIITGLYKEKYQETTMPEY